MVLGGCDSQSRLLGGFIVVEQEGRSTEVNGLCSTAGRTAALAGQTWVWIPLTLGYLKAEKGPGIREELGLSERSWITMEICPGSRDGGRAEVKATSRGIWLLMFYLPARVYKPGCLCRSTSEQVSSPPLRKRYTPVVNQPWGLLSGQWAQCRAPGSKSSLARGAGG